MNAQPQLKYMVASIESDASAAPAELQALVNPPSDVIEDVSIEQMIEAALIHCQTSFEQCKDLIVKER